MLFVGFQDIDLAVAVLCRCCEVAQWSPAKAAEFLMDHPKKHEVLQVFWLQKTRVFTSSRPFFERRDHSPKAFLKAALPDFVGASAGEQVDRLMELSMTMTRQEGMVGSHGKYRVTTVDADAWKTGDC